MASTHSIPHTETTSAQDTAQRTTDKLRDAVSHAQHNVQDAAGTVRDTAVQAAETTADHARGLQGDFDSAVRRNPTVAVLGALGVGIFVGLALTKRA